MPADDGLPVATTDLTCCSSTDNAWFSAGVRNGSTSVTASGMRRRTAAWAFGRGDFRAAIIVHEMLHMLYELLRDAGQGRIRAACYEGFALRAAGIPADPFDVCQCRGTTPCP